MRLFMIAGMFLPSLLYAAVLPRVADGMQEKALGARQVRLATM